MLDPFTAAATATKAYGMVKALVEAGREAHDVMGQIGQCMARLLMSCMPRRKQRIQTRLKE